MERDTARFRLVTAAHRFVTSFVPVSDPESRHALARFVDAAADISLPPAEIDAVLLRTLAVVEPHTGGRRPTRIERYLSSSRFSAKDVLTRFVECVNDLITYRGIGDPLIRSAIAIIERQYHDPQLSPGGIARVLETSVWTLARRFTARTGVNTTTYLRNVRLDRATARLTASRDRVKEVWASVGYNHAANFTHDFKKRFGVSPREYRSRTVNSGLVDAPADENRSGADRHTADRPYTASRGPVLIVDDDDGTRETIGRYLALEGYRVNTADGGRAALCEAARVRPRAILLDYHLPDVEPLECLRALRQSSPKAGVVIFSADWNLDSRAAEFQALGATFLPKLCDLDELGAVVARTLFSSG